MTTSVMLTLSRAVQIALKKGFSLPFCMYDWIGRVQLRGISSATRRHLTGCQYKRPAGIAVWSCVCWLPQRNRFGCDDGRCTVPPADVFLLLTPT